MAISLFVSNNARRFILTGVLLTVLIGSIIFPLQKGKADSSSNASRVVSLVSSVPTGANGKNLTAFKGNNSANLYFPDPAPPTLSVSNVTIIEADSGSTNAVFTVTLNNGPSNGNVTATALAVDRTALSGTDFAFISAQLVFAPGETTKLVSVPVFGDVIYEGNETFAMELRNVQGAGGADAIGLCTIIDNEQLPTLSINDVRVTEGNSGTPEAVFTVTLSGQTSQQVSYYLTTESGTALDGEDFSAVAGASMLGPFSTKSVITVPITDDTLTEPDETFFLDISNATNATIIKGRGVCTITDNESAASQPTVQFAARFSSVPEDAGRVQIVVTRSGDPSQQVSVDYRTVDNDPFIFGCDETLNGLALGRCDFATAVGTLNFAAGEMQKTITVPIVDDAYVERQEPFFIELSNSVGGNVGRPSSATVRILDNDQPGETNPIFNTSFFVRQQYLDFLSREPESSGFDAWVNLLNNCSDLDNNPNCDRLLVSSSFFGSPEFQLKGFYVFRFYRVAFNRKPQYLEIIPDMSFVAGSTADEVFQRKEQFAENFLQRPEFLTAFGVLSNSEYVSKLLNSYQLSRITSPDPANPDGPDKVVLTATDLVNKLSENKLNRAQVLRAIADSDEVSASEFNAAFVAMQYYGYLRRTPEDSGYEAWLNYLNSHPSDFRTMVNGFMNSIEYRRRFAAAQ
jgi:hypothetical protein